MKEGQISFMELLGLRYNPLHDEFYEEVTYEQAQNANSPAEVLGKEEESEKA